MTSHSAILAQVRDILEKAQWEGQLMHAPEDTRAGGLFMAFSVLCFTANTLLINYLGDPEAAYLFMREDGGRLRKFGRAKQFDAWFLRKAQERGDWAAMARWLTAIYRDASEDPAAYKDLMDLLFEKLDLLLAIRDNEIVTWSGKFRTPLENQASQALRERGGVGVLVLVTRGQRHRDRVHPEKRSLSRAADRPGVENVVTEVAKKVNVAHVLEGSIRKSGNKIRVTAQLIDGLTDTHLWSETYDREIDDIFVIQDDISARVVEELKVRLLGQQPLAQRVDPQAYDLFLQALYILNQGDAEDELKRAESLLLRALELEPDFPAAISELARAYWNLSPRDASGRYQQLRDEQLERLIALDPDGTEANTWLAIINTWEARRPHEAARYMEAAVAADPGNVRTLRVAAFFLAELGRTDEAIAVGNFIVRRDPACGGCVSALANAYRRSGRHAEAVETLEATACDW